MNTILTITIGFTLLFSLTNGMNDGNNVMATAVASGALPRKWAIIIVTIAELSGPFLFGIPVALTVANGIIKVNLLPHNLAGLTLILSGIVGAIICNFLAWTLKLPTSSSFALVGGLIGPVLYHMGKHAIPWHTLLIKVIGAMVLSPILGILIGIFVYKITASALSTATIRANKYLKRTQIITLAILGSMHGTNDSQKGMGIIAVSLFLANKTPILTVPLWVMTVSATALATGITMGGTKIIKTVGYGIFKIRPIHSLSAQLSAISILLTCNLIGTPVSTTQVISSSAIGVGHAYRKKMVRWKVTYNIFISWVLTIPLAATLGIGVYKILNTIGGLP